MSKLKAISLFSSSGIGDLGLHANGIDTVVACELLEERMGLFQRNNPNTKCFCGDIWELGDKIVEYYKSNFEDEPFVILATPPCQGIVYLQIILSKGFLMMMYMLGKFLMAKEPRQARAIRVMR